MQADLLTVTDFYILDQNFNKILSLTQYESLMWVDKYDEPGYVEIYAPPIESIKEAAQIGNYIQSNKSEHVMIIEKLVTTFSATDGERLVISGRSLESILDRRVLFLDLYFRNKKTGSGEEIGADNLEDAIRQLLDYTFINPENDDRKVNNLIFRYSNEDIPLSDRNRMTITDSNNEAIVADYVGNNTIHDITLKDMEFSKGENILNIVNTIVKSRGLGYKITLDANNNFVFELIQGKDRTSDQNENPLVEFSPMFNNVKDTKFTVDAGENFKNYIYTEGEIYKSQAPKIIETGDATGLNRREYYISSGSTHETEGSNTYWNTETQEYEIKKEKKTLTNEEYEDVLKEEGEKSYKAYSAKTNLESEIEPRLQFEYGRDFFIGDILQVKDNSGNTAKTRVVEFIISHSSSGYEEYPTFEDITEETDTPSQTTATGGEYSDEGKQTPNEIMFEALKLMMPVGYIYQTTDPTTPDVKFGFGQWVQHSGYMLRGATSGVKKGNEQGGTSNDGGADSVTVSSVANHNHNQNSHNHRQNIEIAGYEGWSVSQTSYMQYAGFANPASRHRAATGTNINTDGQTATNIANGANYTVNTLPKYKNVYIWERTV